MRVRCPNTNCQKVIEVADASAGKPVQCPGCGSQFSAPSTAFEPWKSSGRPTEVQEATIRPTVISTDSAAGQEGDLPEATLIMPAAKVADDPLLGLVLGGCRLQSKLGEGGMGAVYRARHEGLDIDVAVKVLPRFLAERRPDFIERFQREARVAARLDHPNVVRVHNVGEQGGQHFLVMEFVEGESLKNRLDDKKKLDLDEALDIVQQVLLALDVAHEKGIIHRDIKPDNILLKTTKSSSSQKGGLVAKLADLGLAKITSLTDDSAKGGNTVSGVMMGTVDYMAPEQADDAKRVDTRADIYALGCTMFQMIAGQKPYTAESTIQLILKHMSAEIPDLKVHRQEIPGELADMVKKMLAKSPSDRFQSAGEALQALEKIRSKSRIGKAKEGEATAEEAPVPPPAAELKEGICPNPSCRRPNRLEAKWCAFCGTSMVEKCLKCGGDVRIGGTFCIHCGTNFLEERKVRDSIDKVRKFLQAKQPTNALTELQWLLSAHAQRTDVIELKELADASVRRLAELREMAAKAEESEDYESAKQSLEEALELSVYDESIRAQLEALPERMRQRDINRMLTEAQNVRDSKRPRAALELYDRILELEADQSQALAGRRTCERANKRVANLQKQLQQHTEQGELRQAVEVCRSILEVDIEEKETAALLAELEKRVGQVNQAMEEARRLAQAKKWDAAIEAWQAVQTLWPANPEIQQGLQTALQARDQWSKRIEEARRWTQEKELERAEQALVKALEVVDWPEGQKLLEKIRADLARVGKLAQEARQRAQEKQWQPSINAWKEVLELWPSHIEARQGATEAGRMLEKFDRFRELAHSLASDRNLTLAEEMLVAALGAGHWPEGQKILEEVRSDLVKLAESIQHARDYAEQKQWSSSIDAWQHALKLSPVHPEAQEGLELAIKAQEEFNRLAARAKMFVQQQDLVQAEEMLLQALKVGDWPDGEKLCKEIRDRKKQGEQHLTEGWKYFEAKEWARASESFQQALKTWPGNERGRQGLENAKAAEAAFRLAVDKATKLVGIRSLAEAEQALLKAVQAGSWPEGLNLLQKVQDDLAKSKELLSAAHKQAQEMKWAAALDTLKKASQLWPTQPSFKELQEKTSEGERNFQRNANSAKDFLEKRKLGPAIEALEQALKAGDWPEGGTLLKEAREKEATAKGLLNKGQEASEHWIWRAAFKHFVEARAIDEDMVPQEQMEKVSGLARQMEQQIEWLRKWTKEGRYQDVIAEAAKVSKIGSDLELDSLRQNATEKQDQTRRMEAKAEQLEAEVDPKAACDLLEKVLALQPFRKDITAKLQKLKSQHQNAQTKLTEGLKYAGEKQWELARKCAEEALTFNRHTPEAQELIQKAQDKIREKARRKKLLVTGGIVAAVLLLSVWIVVAQARQKKWVASMKTEFQGKVNLGIEKSKEGDVKAEGSLWEEARDFYAASEQSFAEAEQIAAKASLAGERQQARESHNAVSRIVKSLPDFSQKMAEAEANRKSDSWAEAHTAFDRALEIASQAKYSETVLKNVRTARDEMLYKEHFLAAEDLVKAKRWKEAGDTYIKARKIALEGGLNQDWVSKVDQAYDQIKVEVAKAKFEEKMAEGEKMESEERWEEAMTLFNEAIALARDTPLDTTMISKAQMKEQMVQTSAANSLFEKHMKEGSAAMAEDNLEKAVQAFTSAEELAREKSLGEKRQADAKQKLDKASRLQKSFAEFNVKIDLARERAEANQLSEAAEAYAAAETFAREKQLPEKYAKEARENGLTAKKKLAENKYQALFNSGVEQEKAGQWSKAAGTFNDAFRLARESALDDALIKEAQAKLDNAEKMESVNTDFLQQMEKGDRLMGAKNYDEAIRAYDQAVNAAKKERMDNQKIKEASDKLQQAKLELAKARYQVAMDSGTQNLAARRWEDARIAFTEAQKVALETPLDEAAQKDAQSRLGSIRVEMAKVDFEEKNRQAEASEGKDQWPAALEAYAAAATLARDAGLNDLAAEATKKGAEAKTRWHTQRVQLSLKAGDTHLFAQKWQQATEAYKVAEQAAKEGALPDEIAKQVDAKLKRVEELQSGTEAYLAAIKTGDEHAAGRRWKEAKLAFEGGLRVATDKKLGKDVLRDIETKILNAGMMDTSTTEFKRLMQLGQEQLDQNRLQDARQSCTEAERVARMNLREEDKIAEAKAMVAKVTRMEFQAKMDLGKKLRESQQWKEAIEAFKEAENIAQRPGMDKGEVQLAAAERQIAERMEQANRDFGEKMAQAAKLEQAEEWVEARKLYLDALKIAKNTPLSGEQVTQVTQKLDETVKKVPVQLVYSKPDFDAEEASRRQMETGQALGVSTRFDLELAKDVKMGLLLVPAGEFWMGSDKADRGRDKDEGGSDGGKVRIKLTRPYFLGETEVTQGQWYAVMKNNPSKYKDGDNNPVESVSWNDCQDFLTKLNQLGKGKFRLPTEAEWEAACRSGSAKQYWFGDRTTSVKQMDPYMWFSFNSDTSTRPDEIFNPEEPIKKTGRREVKHHAVGPKGGKKPKLANPFGLYDVHGNVFEWCLDWYDKDYFTLVKLENPYLENVLKPKERSIRGGASGCNLWWCRSAEREGDDPAVGYPDVGFRVLMETGP